MTLLLRFLAVCCTLALGGAAFGAEPAIIAKARAKLAPDTVLDAVSSIHYVGTITAPDPANAGSELTQKIEIFLQKPTQQRIVVTSDQVIEISGLDGYDAWRRTIDAKDPSRWQQSQMGSEQVKQLRADVWENLAFFRGIERVGGWVRDEGLATVDGVACRKLAFHHSDELVYIRYFNEATGELVLTGTERNNIRERGELMAGGIRFPALLEIAQAVNGEMTKRTLRFEKITVNEPLPASLFAVPLPTVK